jgi:hypothetical protein
MVFDETTKSLFSSDLFIQPGEQPAIVRENPATRRANRTVNRASLVGRDRCYGSWIGLRDWSTDGSTHARWKLAK